MIFENTGLYGVDRRSRRNVPAYGDLPCTGQFLWPPRLERTTYTYWDPMFIGPRQATFEQETMADGLLVYVLRRPVRWQVGRSLDRCPCNSSAKIITQIAHGSRRAASNLPYGFWLTIVKLPPNGAK